VPSLDQLVSALSDALGVSHGKIEPYSIALRREGLISPSKRGRGSSAPTYRDGAALLIGVLSDGPTTCAHFVREFGSLDFNPVEPAKHVSVVSPLIFGPAPGRSLLDAVAGIVQLFAEGRAGEVFHEKIAVIEPWEYAGPEVEIHAHRPFPCATIDFYLTSALLEQCLATKQKRRDDGSMFSLRFVRDEVRGQFENQQKFFDLLRATDRGVRKDHWLNGRAVEAVGRAITG
jgi:hypothetical protein